MHPVLATPLSPERWPRSFRVAGLVLAWLALAVYFHTPVREAMAPSLDGSNYGSYSYLTAHGFQYGSEVVPMVGPYGFIMYGWTYNGELVTARTGLELLLNGALAALTLWFVAALRGRWTRWLWLAAHLMFSIYSEDLPLEWILLLGGLYLLQDRPGRNLPAAAWLAAAALALVSLIKGTQVMLGFATLGVVAAGLAAHGRWRHAGQVVLGYAGALLGFWVLARQNPLHLPAYLRGILELGGGYTDAMSLPTDPAMATRALLISAGLAATLGWAFWHRRREALVVAALLLLAGHSFSQWKHGLVRADGHIEIFFNYAIVAVLTAHLVAWRDWRGRVPELAFWRGTGLALVTLVLAHWSSVGRQLGAWEQAPRTVAARAGRNASHLLHLRAELAELDARYRRNQQAHLLPLVQAEVGKRPIDSFGWEQGLVMMNGLNYRPRPMGGGSFNAYTPYLLELNRAFVADPARRPDFYLLKTQTVDGRWLTADDGPTLLEILAHYQPVAFEHDHLLLAAHPATAPAAAPRRLSRGTYRWGELIPVPVVGPHEMIVTRCSIALNWRGRVRSALYKSPPVSLAAFDRTGDLLVRRRIIPSIATAPFLLSPLVETNDELVDLYTRDPGRTVDRIRFEGTDLLPYSPLVEVEFLAAPRPEPLPDAALATLRANLQFPYANVPPDRITPPFRINPSVRYLHAPSEAEWTLTGRERGFAFHFGLDREAYETGTTNGVDFIVELRSPHGGVRELFRRALKPRTRPADRGEQAARVALPVLLPGTRLVLRTDPGEFGDTSWDWAYARGIILEREGAYDASLFPGFNRVPDQAEDDNASVLDLDGRPVFLLHVPGSMRYRLTGGEKHLEFEFGFMPGAYTNGGNTQGAAFVVELHSPGQPPRELARRELRPVAAGADRGHQRESLDLPASQAGDELVIRTTELPGCGASWGWTYFSRLQLE